MHRPMSRNDRTSSALLRQFERVGCDWNGSLFLAAIRHFFDYGRSIRLKQPVLARPMVVVSKVHEEHPIADQLEFPAQPFKSRVAAPDAFCRVAFDFYVQKPVASVHVQVDEEMTLRNRLHFQ